MSVFDALNYEGDKSELDLDRHAFLIESLADDLEKLCANGMPNGNGIYRPFKGPGSYAWRRRIFIPLEHLAG